MYTLSKQMSIDLGTVVHLIHFRSFDKPQTPFDSLHICKEASSHEKLTKTLYYALKQRIVIEVVMRSRKRRAKAMKIAAVADGVSSVAFNEENRDQIVVIGDGVDRFSRVGPLFEEEGWPCYLGECGRTSGTSGRYMRNL
ncbi:hypothetical protein M0R45_015459 [Rubus argutus]|uniref:Uncharacterized protein n=1 Tax=Rubus argutus TaxID=59490 RepID=A0AAW1XQ89_RUBAR